MALSPMGVAVDTGPREPADGQVLLCRIVHRVIDRHGGRIWARAAIGQGATFYFDIPDDQDRP